MLVPTTATVAPITGSSPVSDTVPDTVRELCALAIAGIRSTDTNSENNKRILFMGNRFVKRILIVGLNSGAKLHHMNFNAKQFTTFYIRLSIQPTTLIIRSRDTTICMRDSCRDICSLTQILKFVSFSLCITPSYFIDIRNSTREEPVGRSVILRRNRSLAVSTPLTVRDVIRAISFVEKFRRNRAQKRKSVAVSAG